MGDFAYFALQVFACFFLIACLVAGVMALIVKKPFISCLGAMFWLAAAALVVWSFIIDNGSRNGWDFLALLILWGAAAVNFLIGLILCRIGTAQSRKKALGNESVVKTEEPTQ